MGSEAARISGAAPAHAPETLAFLPGDVPLDLSKLDAGVYLLVTTTDGGVPDVERVVVTK